MLRDTLLSLVLGIGVCLLGSWLFFSPADAPEEMAAEVLWRAVDFEGAAEQQSGKHDALRITQNADATLVHLPVPQAPLHPDAYLRLTFDSPAPDLRLTLVWSSPATRGTQQAFAVESRVQSLQYLSLAEIPGLRGRIDAWGLRITGAAESAAALREAAVLPPSAVTRIRYFLHDLWSLETWRRASMNSYSGVTKLSTFYPAPAFAAVLGASLLAYAGLQLVRRRLLTPDWRVVGLICLVCWLALDLPWQYQLLYQAGETRAQFGGKNNEQKLLAGPDSELYALVRKIRPLIEEDTARVFISSSDDYTGLRGNYFLYPHNVFWLLRGPQLPARQFMYPGDYIFVIEPSSSKVAQRAGRYIVDQRSFDVDVLHRDRRGALLRLR